MIGRYSHLGVYRKLLRSGDFYRVFAGAVFALAAYLWEGGTDLKSFEGIALALASVALNGFPIIRGAVDGLLRRRVNVDELVSIAIIASLVKGEFLTAAIVSFVMVLGAVIEKVTAESARNAVVSLMSISPDVATVIADGETKRVKVSEISSGDLLLVKPGERIPVDGDVVEGLTAIDESSVTGEPMPREKKPGDEVYAGTLNQSGVVKVRATRIGKDSTLGRVIQLISDAEAHKPEVVRFIDRYARWFTPLILFCAGVAWLFTGESSRAIAVLIVGCPCALILAAPTAVVASIGRLARAGVLVKAGQYLEEAGRATVVLFDKTGTLTAGEPRVDEIVSVDDIGTEQILAKAACVEQNSTHPLARAILKAAHYAKVSLSYAEEVITLIGLGVRGKVGGELVEVGSTYIGGGSVQLPDSLRENYESFKRRGATPLVVYQDSRPVGVISVSDRVREHAPETIAKLGSLGILKTGVVSGDHERATKLVADSVGLSERWYGLNPEEKLQVIKRYQGEGATVVFVGDGINDAPALSTANVGIAMGAAGTDIALDTADIALMNDDISKIPFLIWLSKRTLKVIKWNIAFGMLFNFIAVIASGGGILSPVMGAVVHNIGSVLVVLSSASLSLVKDLV